MRMIQILIKDIYSVGEIPQERPDYIEEKRWEKIQTIKAAEDKLRSLVSGYLLNYMCGRLKICNPDYSYYPNGKPFIEGVPYAFNLSHSGRFAFLAYHESNEPIGADIQEVRQMRDGMVKKLLHDKEYAFLPEDKELQCLHLNRLWTVKESFVKMTGEGLTRDLRTIYVDFEKGKVRTEDGVTGAFIVGEWEDAYYYSVCTIHEKSVQIEQL